MVASDADDSRAYYARRAPDYDAIYRKPERQADLRALEAWLPARVDGRRLLELACGTGYWTPFLAARAAFVVGLDAAAPVLAIARRRLVEGPPTTAARVAFVQADLWHLPFGPASFDAVLAGHWFSHLPIRRRREFIAGIAAVASPGTRVVLFDNRQVSGSSTPIADIDAAGDSWQLRPDHDGGSIRVLKNFPTEAEVAAAVAGLGTGFEWQQWPYYWAATFRLEGSVAAVGPAPLPTARATGPTAATGPADSSHCPLCGDDNGCAPADSGTFETPCWCMTTDFPPALLERIASTDRGRSCLCARCAAAASIGSTPPMAPRPPMEDSE